MKTNQFSDYIRQYCRTHGLSLTRLAEEANLARSTLYHLLNDENQPKIEHLLALADAMGVHHNVLFRLKWQGIGVLSGVPMESDALIAVDSSGFLDETIPDGMIITAGSTFTKTWTIQNTGDTIWKNRHLLCIDEPVMQNNYPDTESFDDHQLIPKSTIIDIPTTVPKEVVTLSVDYQAPKISGRYISCWKMIDEHGVLCFPHGIGLSVSVLVRAFGVSF